MFPTAHSEVYRNEAGEPIGWSDESSFEPDYDPYAGLDEDWGDDEEEDES